MSNEITLLIKHFNRAWLENELLKFPEIKSAIKNVRQELPNVIFMFKEELTDEMFISFSEFISKHDINYGYDYITGNQLAIAPLLEDDVLFNRYNHIDFTQHLKAEYCLNKVTDMGADGRPVRAEYYHNRQLMAVIKYVFRNFPNTPMMCLRAEFLSYIKADGGKTPNVMIKYKKFNLENATDLQVVIAEREDARKNLISGISGFSIGVLMQAFPEMSTLDIGLMVAPFLNETQSIENEFVMLGTETFRDYIAAIDLLTTPHQWLAVPIDQIEIPPLIEGEEPTFQTITIRDKIVNLLTYETQETHLEIQVY